MTPWSALDILNPMRQDLRFALRQLRRSPGFTAVAILTLALGIGANTTIFSVVNSVLLRPLPYDHPERIVQVTDLAPGTSNFIPSSFPKFNFFHDHARSFRALTADIPSGFQLSASGSAPSEFVIGARVSGDFFNVLGAKPAIGRTFFNGEDQHGAPPVAVISDTLWRKRFGADPKALGSVIGIQGVATTIVGVMPSGFMFPDEAQLWVPRIFEHTVITQTQIQNGASYLLVYGRLADGVEIPAALAEIQTLAGQYDGAHPGFGDIKRSENIVPLRDSIVSDVRRTLLVLLGAVGFVLLIASANIANLLLARATARKKEVAVRAALGASRARLLVQFLTESVLLALLGAAFGLAFSVWSMRAVQAVGPDLLPRLNEIHIDGTVLLFTSVIAVATGILFGLGPAMHSSRAELNDALKASARTLASGGAFRALLIVTEVALATVLLTGAGLLMRSFLKMQNVDPGFPSNQLLTMHVGLAGPRYSTPQQRTDFADRVLQRIASIPGVQGAALSNAPPVNGRAIGYFFNIEGRPALEPTKAPVFWLNTVSPGYFQTLGIPVLAGRAFTAADLDTQPMVAIINETMARRFWPGEDPLGKHIIYARESIRVEIVGIARDVKIGGLGDKNAYNQMYVPYAQRPFLSIWLMARGPASAGSALRREVSNIDPDQSAGEIRSMNELIANSVSEPRLRTNLIGAFAALALILAVTGIGGLVAWSVSQRTNEIGIRMALGARPSRILAMILRQTFTVVGAGQLAGLLGALALTRVLSNFLFGISPEDPATFAAVFVVLGVAALIASAFAARRALEIDPAIALRRE
jgi:putative ABC transport system permease protein